MFFFNETATTEIYTYGHTLSLHDALPISTSFSPARRSRSSAVRPARILPSRTAMVAGTAPPARTAASPRRAVSRLRGAGMPWEIGRAPVCTPVTNAHLVCRLLLEKHKQTPPIHSLTSTLRVTHKNT